jgi:hypothetical protein
LFIISDWLNNGEDNPLKVTAALCIGNLCCSGKNCAQVIDTVSPALIQVLEDHQSALIRDVKLQHAILGALRNLAVDPVGRPKLLENGLLGSVPSLILIFKIDLNWLNRYSLKNVKNV